jgi:hypothetical protein
LVQESGSVQESLAGLDISQTGSSSKTQELSRPSDPLLHRASVAHFSAYDALHLNSGALMLRRLRISLFGDKPREIG